MRWIAAIAVLTLLASVNDLLAADSEAPTGGGTTIQRIDKLRQVVARFRADSDRLCGQYRPQVVGPIHSAGPSLADMLRQLPGATSVSISLDPARPKHRIVHLKDWHFLPRDLFAADLRSVESNPMSDAEIDELYEEFLLEVELVQIQQTTMLRCLVRHHGLRSAFVEGLTDGDLPIYKAKIRVLQKIQRDLPGLRAELDRVCAELASASTSEDEEESAELRSTKQQLESVLGFYRSERLRLGAVGQLVMSGELDRVLPLDDLAAWRKANPLKSNGRVHIERRAMEEREDAQMKRLFAAGPFALVVLGGGHDLADNAARLSNQTCQYVTVATQWHDRLADGSQRE